jgi:cbb3-type cytochrome c oxidase subunit III
VTPAAIAKGDTIFHKTGLCYACHGSNAEGAVGPNLTDAEWLHGDGSYDMIVATVTSGVPAEKAKKGIQMPPKGGSAISDEDVKAVAAYVYSLGHK